MQLPWSPLFTTKRSGYPEVTISGIISIWEGDSKQLLAVGDQRALIWSRSLLKPWQLLCLLPELKKAYPLQPHHLALMLSSHNGEPEQVDLVKEILQLGGMDEDKLQCPACYPMAMERKFQLKAAGVKPGSIFNPCSGKHAAYLLALKAGGQKIADYLNPDARQFKMLQELLGWVLKKQPSALQQTTDGCRLPNFGFLPDELARLYGLLSGKLSSKEIESAPAALQPILANWDELREVMIRYPQLVGGQGRLDSQMIAGRFTDDKPLNVVAKEGADGLLGVGIGSHKAYKQGLGILIKLASGYNSGHLEIVITALLEQLGLKAVQTGTRTGEAHLKTEFHFMLPQYQAV